MKQLMLYRTMFSAAMFGAIASFGALSVVGGDIRDDAVFHFDASDTNTMTIVSENGKDYVTRWNCVSGSRYATVLGNRPFLGTFNGMTVVDFGTFNNDPYDHPDGYGASMAWSEADTGIREVFMVYSDVPEENPGDPFFLGTCGALKTFDFHRDGRRLFSSEWASLALRNGLIQVDRENRAASYELPEGFHILRFRPTAAVSANAFGIDRTYRRGGMRLAEVIVFNKVLSDEDASFVSDLLYSKWSGKVGCVLKVGEASGGSVEIAGTALSEDHYQLGSEVTLTAVPAAGHRFVRWCRECPAGHEFDNPLTVPMDRPLRTITPYFVTDREYEQAEYLVHKWTFNDGTATDSIGLADGTLNGAAMISGGFLVLPDGSHWDGMLTTKFGHTLGDRTLMVWCSVSDPVADKSCSGSPLAVPDGNQNLTTFDAIVLGERTAGQWMNGSEMWNRTPEDNSGAIENSSELVMMALVIQRDPYVVRIYRNGELYAEHSYLAVGKTVPNLSANAQALIGPRNASSGYFRGAVDEARIYAAALTAEDVKAIYETGPDGRSDRPPQIAFSGSTENLVATNGLLKITSATYQVKSVGTAKGVFDIREGRLRFGDGLPQHRWSFNDGTAQDVLGAANGTLSGTATIGEGALHLSKGVLTGNKNYMISSKFAESISAMTLMAWCTVDDPETDGQCAGGPISLTGGNIASSRFNAIVFGERKKGQWMNGSENWKRTPEDNGGAVETSTDKVMIAAVVHSGGAELYRNGEPYAQHTTAGGFSELSTPVAVIGPRNAECGYFNGSVDEARIYESPLTAEEVAAIAARGPDGANGEVDEALSNVVVRLGGTGTVFDLGLVPRLVKGITGAGAIQNGQPHVSENLCATGTLAFADGLALGEGAEIGVVGNESVIRVSGALTLPAKATVVAAGLTNGTESVELMRSTLPVDWATLTKGWKFSTDARGRSVKPCWTETTLGLKLGKSGMVLLLK